MPNKLFTEIAGLRTEQINPATKNIDTASTREILELINNEDSKVHSAVRDQIHYIEKLSMG